MIKLVFLGIFLTNFFSLTFSRSAFADHPVSEEIAKICNENKMACKEYSRLSPYEPNYVIWQDTDGDEQSLEVHYSFRYMFTRPHCMKGHDFLYDYSPEDTKKCIEDYPERWEVFFAYTGEFDFYMGTRDSGPVINRVSNPGFHYRKYISNSSFEWLNLSAEHRSNGQVTEIDERDGAVLKTQLAYNNNNYEYFDGLSRGSNYIQLETKIKVSDTADIYINLKHYASQNTDVNWGPEAANDPSISDYDRIRFIWTDRWMVRGKRMETSIEWLMGDEGLDTDSFDFAIAYPFKYKKLAIPFYVRYHSGPMNTLSNYTLDQNSLGIGIKLIPF